MSHHVDRYPLINLSLGRKAAVTLGMVTGLVLFYLSMVAAVLVTTWGFSASLFLGWGDDLVMVLHSQPTWFWSFFGLHTLSLVILISLAARLFRLTALPRGARYVLIASARLLGLLDLACWLLLTTNPAFAQALGPILLLESALLAFLVGRPLRDMWWYRHWKSGGHKRRVVVVGGGFSGLDAALGLDRKLGYHPDLEIVVMDKKNYFLFPPLLPSVATGTIETRQVTYPFRRIFEATNIRFRKELVERIDPIRKTVFSRVDIGEDPQTREVKVVTCETPYDYLVLAPGSDTQTFNTPGVREHAFFMREVGDAVAVRNQIIDCFERAGREENEAVQRELLTFVVVGAGPTGVELAAEVHDLIEHVLLRRYPEVGRHLPQVIIVQSGSQILPGWHPTVVGSAAKQLGTLKVEVVLGDRVTQVAPFAVTLKGGRVIPTRSCIWCAGVRPASLLGGCALPKDPGGRIPVDPDLRVAGLPEVFVLGDAAMCVDKGKALPPLGQVAFQQGALTAKNLVRLLRGQPTRPFRYFNFGALVSVGEHHASVDLLGIRLSGFLGWMVWRTLYLGKLVGFSNKVRVVIDWTLDLLVERSISQISASRQDVAEEKAELAAQQAEAEAKSA